MKTRYNQSLIDIALQEYGSLEGLVSLAHSNNIGITDLLTIGEELTTGEAVNTEVVQFYKDLKYKVAVGAEMISTLEYDETDYDYLDYN